VNLLALKFGTDVVNIGMLLQKKFMKKTQFLSPREGVKVGSKLAAMKKVCNFMVPDCTIPNDLKFFKHVANLP